jgi:hypothetical protein
MATRRGLVIALFALAIATIGTGFYFMVLRPPLLPEDARFTELAGSDVSPRLLRWLSIVFRTWGGFLAGFGACLIGQAGYFHSSRDAWLRVCTAIGVLFAFGSFLASNIELRSDFLWFIAMLFVIAVASAVLLLRDSRGPER